MCRGLFVFFFSTTIAFSNVLFQAVEGLQHLSECAGGHLPYDANRVRLSSGNFYNASYLVRGGEAFIVAQTPEEVSEEAFWETVAQEKVRVIVAFDEGESLQKGEKRLFSQFHVRCIDERGERLRSGEYLTQRYHILTTGNGRRGVIELSLSEKPSASMMRLVHKRIMACNVEGHPILLHAKTASGPIGKYIEVTAEKGVGREQISAQRYALFN